MITRWQPERRSFEQFNKMMDDVFGVVDHWTPSVDVKETEKELTFVVELSGMTEKDVQVELTGNLLTIRGTRELSKEENKDHYIRIERNYGTFMRSFTIDSAVNPDSIHADFKHGLLTVVVPKVETKPSLKIPIRAV